MERACKDIYNHPPPPTFGLMRCLLKSKDVNWSIESTPVRDICIICRPLFGVSTFLCSTRVHLGHFMLCYEEEFKVELSSYTVLLLIFRSFLQVIGLSAVIYILLSLCRL